MSEEKDWYLVNGAEEIDSPALLIYPERVKHNIETAKQMVGEVSRLRPHVKTHKNSEVAKLQLEAGITKFKCATIAEAEILAMCKAHDVLLAYQPSGPKLKRFIALILKYPDTKFSCLVDNEATAHLISVEAQSYQLRINVYIDLNVGMNRTGIKPDSKAQELYLACNLMPGITPIGLHAYDGHIHDSDLQERTGKSIEIYESVKQLQQAIVKQGITEPVIIAGGSPTFPVYAEKKDVECSPGTFIYWDAGYLEAFQEQKFLPAAVLLSRIISLPSETRICLDLGHKSVGAENALNKRVRFLNANGLVPVSQSEEHLIVEAPQYHGYKPGDVFYLLPFHVCPTVALYERVAIIINGDFAGEWMNIARDRKITV